MDKINNFTQTAGQNLAPFAKFESRQMISCIFAAFFEENPLKTTHSLVNLANILKKL